MVSGSKHPENPFEHKHTSPVLILPLLVSLAVICWESLSRTTPLISPINFFRDRPDLFLAILLFSAGISFLSWIFAMKAKQHCLSISSENLTLMRQLSESKQSLRAAQLRAEHRLTENNNLWTQKFEQFKTSSLKQARESLREEVALQREWLDQEWNRLNSERKNMEKMKTDTDFYQTLLSIEDQFRRLIDNGTRLRDISMVGSDNYRRGIKQLVQSTRRSLVITLPSDYTLAFIAPYLENLIEQGRNIQIGIRSPEALINDLRLQQIDRIGGKLHLSRSDVPLFVSDYKTVFIPLIPENRAIFVDCSERFLDPDHLLCSDRIRFYSGRLLRIEMNNHFFILDNLSFPVNLSPENLGKVGELRNFAKYTPKIHVVCTESESGTLNYHSHQVQGVESEKRQTYP